MSKKVFTTSFNLAPKALNSGEGLILTTEYYWNGEDGIFTNQKITLHSYENSASINLYGIQLNSKLLRELADELDRAKSTAQQVVDDYKNQHEDTYEI